jgi:hypothetical protein
VLAAPWRLWVQANGPFAGDVTALSTSLDVGFLVDRLDRLNAAGHTVLARFTETGHGWLMPAFLAVTIALLIAGPRRRVPAFYLGGVVLSVAALLWVYWTTSQPDWFGHYTRTSIRTITGPLFVAAAALGHLLPRSVGWPVPEGSEPDEPPVAAESRSQQARSRGPAQVR